MSSVSAAPSPPAPTTAVRSSHYGPAAVLGSALLIAAVVGAIGVAASAVHDRDVTTRDEKMTAGNVSVVGSAKTRDWINAAFAVKVPARWHLISDGRITDAQVHVWEGLPGGRAFPTGEGASVCEKDAICLEVSSQNPRVGSGVGAGTGEDVRNFQATQVKAERDQSTGGTQPHLRQIDYGPVTAKGGRWVSRGQYRAENVVQTSYYFATCAPGGARTMWEVRMTALANAVPTFAFNDVLASFTTTDPSPGPGQGCVNIQLGSNPTS